MLHISPEQQEAWSRRHEEQFIDRLTESAATAYPEMVWMRGAAGLRVLVGNYIEEGRRFGLSYEYTLGRYAYWRLDHGDGILTESEWEFFRDLLQDDTMAQEEKVFTIDTLLYGTPLYPEIWDYE